jgi:ABC-type multidrug transport system ATPase subunit/ABC-type multidrug transport system permease subunit
METITVRCFVSINHFCYQLYTDIIIIECAHGGNGPDKNNICDCPPGWTGINCLMCTSNLACESVYNTTNTTGVCDTSLVAFTEKYFQCDITDYHMINLIGNITSLRCGGMNSTLSKNGTCIVQFFDGYPVGPLQESIYCTFSDCSLSIPSAGQIEYNCLHTHCNCSSQSSKCANPFVKYVVSNMKTWAKVQCDNPAGNNCVVKQAQFPGEIAARCKGSECLQSYRPPPPAPPEDRTMLYVGIGIGCGILVIVVITIIITIIGSCYQTVELNKEYSMMKDNSHGAKIEVRNLNYTMKVMHKGKRIRKKLLLDINHTIQPGTVTAIMGPSGAGKTTLLDILANRAKNGNVTGEIYVNGKLIDASYPRICGYVFQDDNLMSTMTVRESIMFSANLRLPDAMGYAEKSERVDQVLADLGISHLRDRKIGDHMNRGISGGEKRRVSIGMELVTSPHILYLDEPTSGLDSASAFSVMKTIVDLSKQGRTIVFSIHQPRSNIFAQFDEIILMRSGRIAYAGRADKAVGYFSKIAYECPPNFNPADYLIDVLTQSQANKLFNYQPVNQPSIIKSPFNNNNNKQQQQQQQQYGSFQTDADDFIDGDYESQQAPLYQSDSLKDMSGTEQTHLGTIYEGRMLVFATSFYSQLSTLSSRAFKNFYRNFYLMPAHFLSGLIMGILLGLIYYQLGNNIAACQNRMGSIFFMCSLLAFGAMSSLELFITERSIFVRERANGYYRPTAYFISKTLFDIIPLRIIPPIIMGSIAYWLIGLRTEFTHFLWFLLIMVLFNIVSGALCIAIGAIAPSVASGNVTATLFILASSLFSGFLLNKDSIPSYLSWIKYLSFWNYAFEALLINELYGFKVIIDPKGMPSYPADGNFFLQELGMDYRRFYIDVVILAVFAVVYIVASGILMKLFVKEKR